MFATDQTEDVDIVDILIEMYVNAHNTSLCSEDKEPLSEGESGASSEEHQDRHHHHYSNHPGLRGESMSHVSSLTYFEKISRLT